MRAEHPFRASIWSTRPEVRRLLVRVGLTGVITRFVMFVLPRLGRQSEVEHHLDRLPLGGQYVVVAERRGQGPS